MVDSATGQKNLAQIHFLLNFVSKHLSSFGFETSEFRLFLV
tara:strand:+ start:11198 stop:11320 length:123 start_codon:yes stop_codon:yes gene_type:complete